MFREMRRKKQLLSQSDAYEILKNGSFGVLAVLGDDGYPYAVPISYALYGETICFHCAKAGHKLDAIRRCGKVSFCVTDRDDVVPAEFTTYFRSAIAFGIAKIVDDIAEARRAAELIARKYAPNESDERISAEIDREMSHMCIVEITIEHLTGKEAIELVRGRDRG